MTYQDIFQAIEENARNGLLDLNAEKLYVTMSGDTIHLWDDYQSVPLDDAVNNTYKVIELHGGTVEDVLCDTMVGR